MSNNKKKKQREKAYLDLFLKKDNFIPQKYDIEDERESPDFILKHGYKTIGIEICELYRDMKDNSLSLQAQQKMKKRLLERALTEFNKMGVPCYRIFVSFEERSIINKQNIDKLAVFIAQKIKETIAATKPADGKPIILGRWCLKPHDNVVSMIQIHNFGKYNDYRWTQNNVSTVDNLNYSNLSNTIKKKEELLKGYQKCDEMWLLIVIDFFNPTMDHDIPNGFKLPIGDSKFDRIILFKTTEETCFLK